MSESDKRLMRLAVPYWWVSFAIGRCGIIIPDARFFFIMVPLTLLVLWAWTSNEKGAK